MRKVIVDCRLDSIELENLNRLGCKALLCPVSQLTYEAVSGHPDILLHFIDNSTLIVSKDMPSGFISELKDCGLKVLLSSSSLKYKYPDNIMLNGISLEELFIHNLKYTDKLLLKLNENKKLINVKQGYTKCSTAIVKSDAFITSDVGIANALSNQKFDVLLLPPGDIILPGLNYGFIGGCCGLLEDKLMVFYGNLDKYAYGKEVLDFLKKHRVEPYFLSEGKLVDRGSIFVVP